MQLEKGPTETSPENGNGIKDAEIRYRACLDALFPGGISEGNKRLLRQRLGVKADIDIKSVAERKAKQGDVSVVGILETTRLPNAEKWKILGTAYAHRLEDLKPLADAAPEYRGKLEYAAETVRILNNGAEKLSQKQQ
jgi:hypothetical protein